MDLFDGSDDASDAAGEEEGVIGRVGDQLTVNKSYASRFENRKRKQEMAQLRQLHGDLDSEEDASSEDEDGKMLTRELDLKIFKAIDAVRQKRPEVYKPEAAFFDQGEGAEGEDSSGDSDGEGGEKDGAGSSSAKAPRELRRALSVKTCGAGAEGAADEEDEELLIRREVAPEEREAEADEYASWLKQQLSRAGPVDEAVTLRRYMLEEDLPPDEAFLRDYMLNAMWKRPAGGTFSDREDDFERSHNFRYEEAGAARVVSHPRQVEGSLRRQAELGRKRQAKAEASERRAALKEKKAAELRRLKNLKKAEILERLQAIEKVSGGAGSLEGVDLSGDFDPDAWDKQMAAVFNDDYYAAADPELAAELEAAEEAGVGWGEEEAGGEADEAGPSAELQKTTQQYMDEYYALDYEDVLGEGEDALPTRFKYRAVEPAGFGLTDRELLELDDKELGKIVPTRLVKRPYAQWDAARVKSRAKRVRWEAEAARRAEEGSAGGPGKRGGRLAERPAGDERREKIKRPREAPETTPAAQAQTSTKVAAASRLEAFAKVNKRSKREAREARKERKKKGTF
ncbi:hypothetical protein EMIHUDRAFT_209871 [Emiliania huxleyi CCMP1516]|uniref:Kri1-like C-terminal domain-containing protein n=2 Tax=Emiliania huxleyi TaxID=2903 RepID=A0A0D3J2X3_EMIH1|nr:hypothetical protein EMIHUDRAFT_209871 [Emiliania huxleyi CCMP1516]EOD17858.1 hypothetical protein EMIHUDRAFT_209871 [Emiliania huxleyi CCMP1516]|eukprot:XP_005770287.1 hypothetical protein EMIHUDRAFT_209871 [Emiliania huxleyi CCMP1516]